MDSKIETEKELDLIFHQELKHDFKNYPPLGTAQYNQHDDYEAFYLKSEDIGITIVDDKIGFLFVYTQPSCLEMDYRNPNSRNISFESELYKTQKSTFFLNINYDEDERIVNPKDVDPRTRLPLFERNFQLSVGAKATTYGDLLDYELAKEYLQSLWRLSGNLCSIGMVLTLYKESDGGDLASEFLKRFLI
jgi:hypothetical protein